MGAVVVACCCRTRISCSSLISPHHNKSNKMANIDPEELEEIKERFDMYDKKGDGKVEDFQVIDVMRACGLNPLTADVQKMIVDSDLKGKRVDLETFCGIHEQIKTAPGQAGYEDMMEAFKTYDKDNAGTMSGGTLRQLLINVGDVLKEDDADKIVDMFEDKDSGTISCQGMIVPESLSSN